HEPLISLVEQVLLLPVNLHGVAYPSASYLVRGCATLVEHALYAERATVLPVYRTWLHRAFFVYIYVYRHVSLSALCVHSNFSPVNTVLTHYVSNGIMCLGTIFPTTAEV